MNRGQPSNPMGTHPARIQWAMDSGNGWSKLAVIRSFAVDRRNVSFITATAKSLGMPNSHGPRRGTRNKLRNAPRDRGTSPPQRQVEQFDVGETVHLRLDPSVPEGQFHPRFNGHTGEIVGRQGRAYKVKINDGGTEKFVIGRPAHLRSQQR